MPSWFIGEKQCPARKSRRDELQPVDASSMEENAVSEKKPVVAQIIPKRGLCPVCGKASYSSTGTHPQCAVAHADALSRDARKAAGIEVSKELRKSWSKPCPKCKHQIPARRIVCDCGHKFESVSTATSQFSRKPVETNGKKPR